METDAIGNENLHKRGRRSPGKTVYLIKVLYAKASEMKKEEELIRIYTGSEVSVILLKGELEQIGIESMIQNDFDAGLSAGFISGVPSAVDLYIQKSDLKKAKPFIDEFVKNNES